MLLPSWKMLFDHSVRGAVRPHHGDVPHKLQTHDLLNLLDVRPARVYGGATSTTVGEWYHLHPTPHHILTNQTFVQRVDPLHT